MLPEGDILFDEFEDIISEFIQENVIPIGRGDERELDYARTFKEKLKEVYRRIYCNADVYYEENEKSK
jgi:hypothetical protein